MPNHVTNRLHIPKEYAEDVLLQIKSDEPDGNIIDFNSIIPCPASLSKFSSNPRLQKCAKAFVLKDETYEEQIEVYKSLSLLDQLTVEKSIRNYRIHHYFDWYDWCCNNWGTKWNAYSISKTESEDYIIIQFDTAWSTPQPVIEALSRMFPKVPLLLQYADEDLGSNLGEYELLNGEITSCNIIEDFSEESFYTAICVIYGKEEALEIVKDFFDDEEDTKWKNIYKNILANPQTAFDIW